MAIINGSSINGMTLQADYSYTQNISANTTTVTVTLKLADHYALYASALSGSYISVGGNKANYSRSISYGGSTTTTTTLATKTVTVNHNADGTGTCTIGGTFVMNGTYRGTYIGTLQVSSTVTLPKIARASTIARFANSGGTTISEIDTGSTFRVYWSTAAVSSFKYRIQCVAPGGTYTYPSSSSEYFTASSGYASIQSDHSWLPNQTSHRMEVRLYTYNSSGSQIGTTQISYLTLNVPGSVAPVINSFVVEAIDSKDGWSVQGRSRVRLTANATKGSGAANIVSYTFNGNNIVDGGSSTTLYSSASSYAVTTAILQYTGDATYTVTVIDSRGRRATASLSITVFAYSPPAISSMSVQRCTANGTISSNGTYALVTVNSTYSSINGANTRTITLSNSSDNYASSVVMQATNNTNNSYSYVYGGNFAIGTTYTIRATITDYSNSASMSAPLKAAERPMNILPNGKGVAIGKMAESQNLFDVAWNERIRGNLQVDGILSITGNINGATVGSDTYIVGGSRDNITDENWLATFPSFIGTYSQGNQWYSTLSLRHRNGKEDGTNYGMQMRSILTQEDNLSWRQHINGNWGSWKTILDSNNTADYVIEQGTQGDWTYRKWNSGFAECWRNVSVTPSTVNGTNNLTLTLPFTFANTSYNVTITPAKASMYVDRWGDSATDGAITHTTTNFTMAYNYAYSTAYAVSFNVVVNGKWK